MIATSHLKILVTIITFFLLLNNSSKSQQFPMFRQLQNNPYFYNPACTGSTDYIYLLSDYRKQWVDLKGSPESMTISADIPVKIRKIGVGINLYSDRVNIISNNMGFITYSYKIRINEKHGLSFGLSTGVIQNRIHADKIIAQNPYEPGLLINNNVKTNFDANIGILYSLLDYKFGFAAYQVLGNKFRYSDYSSNDDLEYNLVRHYNLSFSTKFKLPNNLTGEPLVILWNTQGMPAQIELGSTLSWSEKYWLNCSYRHNYGLTLGLGGYFYNRFTLGYSYDFSTTRIGPYAGSSHEVVLGIRLYSNDKKAFQSAENYDEDSRMLKEISQKQFENIDRLKDENKKLKEELEIANSDIRSIKKEIDKLKTRSEQNSTSIDEVIEKYSVQLSEMDLNDSIISSNNTSLIRNNKNYVIIGAYLKMNHALKFQQIMKKKFQLETNIITREDGKYIFVYTKEVTNANEARSEIKRLESLQFQEYVSGNIWIFGENK